MKATRAGGLWAQKQRSATETVTGVSSTSPVTLQKQAKARIHEQHCAQNHAKRLAKITPYKQAWKEELQAAKREHRPAGGGSKSKWTEMWLASQRAVNATARP